MLHPGISVPSVFAFLLVALTEGICSKSLQRNSLCSRGSSRETCVKTCGMFSQTRNVLLMVEILHYLGYIYILYI